MRPDVGFLDALKDDLNTSKAFARLHALSKGGEKEQLERLFASIKLLGFGEHWEDGLHQDVTHVVEGAYLVDNLVGQLKTAREEKNWGEADRLKAALVGAGVKLMIGKTDVTYELEASFDPAKLEALK